MIVNHIENSIVIDAGSFTLRLYAAPAASCLIDKRTGRVFGFCAGGDCNALEQKDEAIEADQWKVSQDKETVLLKCEMKSSIWERKSFCGRISEEALEFWHELEGGGELDDVRFFRMVFNGCEYGFAGDIDEIYNVAPNFKEQQYYHPAETAVNCYGDDLSMHSGGIALASTPHVFGLHDRRDKGYAVVGAFAPPGEYDWDDFVWNPLALRPPTPYKGDAMLGGGFAIGFHGKKRVDGQWNSPRLCITFSESEKDVLSSALEHAYQRHFLPRPLARHECPAWWLEPIYCTWHDQVALSVGGQADFNKPPKRTAASFCTQQLVDHWLDVLESNGCRPGTVILDDEWQSDMTSAVPNKERWPDMRGWIEKCHGRGIRVFLWCLAWQSRNLLPEEAITRDGVPLCGDITNPKHEERIRRMVRGYFGSGPNELNADGVKIDGLLLLPTGKGLKNHKSIWGLELQRYFLRIFYDEAKKTKSDACVSVFSANPYLDDYTDMVRLGDMYTWRLTPRRSMEIRADVLKATHPGVPIDTDGQFHFCATSEYLKLLKTQTAIGIPTIYNAETLRHGRFFFLPELKTLDATDYKAIGEAFNDYRNRLSNF